MKMLKTFNFTEIKRIIARNHNNIHGFQTRRKIVVIESDDWGSIRMPSKKVYDDLKGWGINIELCPYSKFDSLASEEDLQYLFDSLIGFKNRSGISPIITANTVVANPDFNKIKESGFSEYHYELFTETLNRYPEHQNSFKLWKKGIGESIFQPQFHAREHVNIKYWLKKLNEKDSIFSRVFRYGLWGLVRPVIGTDSKSIQASYDCDSIDDIEEQKRIIQDGLSIYESIFSNKSKSFIAPNFVYHTDLEPTIYEEGVRYIQGMKYQKLPLLGRSKREMIRHYQGEKNKLNQYYLVRNCIFEPSQYPLNHDNVGECLKGIQNAFFWKKPAIITSHRLNFIGYIHPENRERNLKQFRELLGTILKKWPDVEFMTSTELGDLIAASDQPV